EFDVSKRTTAATKLQEGDQLLAVFAASEHAHIVLASENGYFLRFAVSEIPLKKKTAIGVRGMKLSEGDFVANVYRIEKGFP
ncbi:MAG: DNA topoisomerase, partial [Lachnospiraceae bacterium]|nr:DNA topoisomerase [Lachnospiraceae bacterium]